MLSTQFPLDVKVTEQDGQLTTFSVPVTALQTPADAPLYGSVALGKVRETVASDESAPAHYRKSGDADFPTGNAKR